MRVSLHRLLLILGLMTSVLAFGTVGFQIVEGASLFDAFYMSLITLTTVGYGEVFELSTEGRIFNSILMLWGVTATFTSIALLADLVIKLELIDFFGRRRKVRMLNSMSHHYIVCGAGRVGRAVVEELRRSGVPVVVIDSNETRLAWAEDLGAAILAADATADDTLRQAGIDRAEGLVAALSSDADNVYVTLAARSLNFQVRISARCSDNQAADRLRTAGANSVLTPYQFIGHRLAQSMLRPHVLSFLDMASAFQKVSGRQLEIGQVGVGRGAPVGKSLAESAVRTRYKVIVLAIQKKDAPTMKFNPEGETVIEDGDMLIAMGDVDDLRRMENDFK